MSGKLNAKQDGRKLHVYEHINEDLYLVLIERERHTVFGKNKWDEERVSITLDEFDRLAKYVAALRARNALPKEVSE